MLQFWENFKEITIEEQNLLDGENIKNTTYCQCESTDSFGNNISNSVTLQISPRFCNIPMHRHERLEMMYVHTGKVFCNIDGKTIELQRENLLVTPPGVTHSLARANFSDIALCIDFSQSLLKTLVPMLSDGIIKQFASESNYSDYLLYNIEQNSTQFNALENLVFALQSSNQKQLISKLALLMLEYLNTDECLLNANTSGKQNTFKQQLNNYIDSNITTATLEQFANSIGYDWQYLSRKITSVFGKNFKQLLIEKRLLRAETLLKATNMNIAEIASAIGYTESSYFYKVFYQKHLATPNEWRRSQNISFDDTDQTN